MGSKKKCVVIGCHNTQDRQFSFPVPHRHKQRFLTWLSVCGNSALLQLPVNKIIHRSVCHNHFEKKYFLSRRLSVTAVPTLKLPEPIDVSSYKLDDEQSVIETTNLHEENAATLVTLPKVEVMDPVALSLMCYEAEPQPVLPMTDTRNCVNLPWRIKENELDPFVQFMKDIKPPVTDFVLQEEEKQIAMTMVPTIFQKNHNIETSVECVNSNKLTKIPMHIARDPKFQIHQMLPETERTFYTSTVSRRHCRTELEMSLRKTVRSLKTTLDRYKRQNKKLREKLRNADKYIFEGVPEDKARILNHFFDSQIRNFKRNKFSRRYTFEDNIFAFALYKQSSKAYQFLSRIFCLPSQETLRKLSENLDVVLQSTYNKYLVDTIGNLSAYSVHAEQSIVDNPVM